MSQTNHIHKYKQIVLNGEHVERRRVGDRPDGRPRYKKFLVKSDKGTIIYKCVLPRCNHFIAKALVQGRESICWVCEKPVIITTEMMNLVKPRHFQCRSGAAAPDAPDEDEPKSKQEAFKDTLAELAKRLAG
jgi:hypothetical protein